MLARGGVEPILTADKKLTPRLVIYMYTIAGAAGSEPVPGAAGAHPEQGEDGAAQAAGHGQAAEQATPHQGMVCL